MIVLTLMWAILAMPDGKLRLIFCDVGQGDASLVVKGSFQMLIDTGPKNGGVMECLSKRIPFWDRTIEVVINTHSQSDHNGAMGEVTAHYRIGKLVTAKEMKKGDRIRYGELVFDILWPSQKQVEQVLGANTDPNETALVMELTTPSISVLYTSDIGTNQELALMEEGVLGAIDILKVAHHGSKYSSSSTFIDRIRPKWAVVSVGAKNGYGHPASEILKRFDTLGSRLLRTDKDGEVVFVVDEKRYWMK